MTNKETLVQNKQTINLVFRTIGNTFIILALLFLFLGFWPYLQAEFGYNWNQLIGQQFIVGGDKVNAGSSPLGAIVKSPPPISITPISTDFAVIIPKIDVNTLVSQDVDASDYNAYMTALTKGAAHAKGTVYPGQDGNSYIFAHSTLNFWDAARYNAVFTLLRKMEPGDLIVTFYKGKRYDYVVTEKLILPPDDVRFLTAKADGKQLTLQTCDPPGINLNRLLVIAKIR